MPKINRSQIHSSVASGLKAESTKPSSASAKAPAPASSSFQPAKVSVIRSAPTSGPVSLSLPVGSSAGYPFTPENYGISLNSVYGPSQFQGRIKEIYFGFTPKTKGEYLRNNDVPWNNRKGEAVAEGVIKVGYHHDGGYKGTIVMDDLPKIEVPEGMNLVFKLRIEKFGGNPYQDGDTTHQGEAETMTYFVDSKNPVR